MDHQQQQQQEKSDQPMSPSFPMSPSGTNVNKSRLPDEMDPAYGDSPGIMKSRAGVSGEPTSTSPLAPIQQQHSSNKAVRWSPQLTQQQSPQQEHKRRSWQGLWTDWDSSNRSSGGGTGGGKRIVDDQGLRAAAANPSNACSTPVQTADAMDTSPVTSRRVNGPPLRSIEGGMQQRMMGGHSSRLNTPLRPSSARPWSQDVRRHQQQGDSVGAVQTNEISAGTRPLDEGVDEMMLAAADGNTAYSNEVVPTSIWRQVLNGLRYLLFG